MILKIKVVIQRNMTNNYEDVAVGDIFLGPVFSDYESDSIEHASDTDELLQASRWCKRA